ncbi:family 16 glycoside hydrolase [Marinilabilia rubra]|uniref:3-keto-alpha-glucoside-1,2-lyase/3-keto-2-hydroxy-glucal hydratase domain-containing protein n=1 Tax=Marinilabilia rubra TaxID=2162893 RepID=A0A2U2B471_9BACT|nr:family 16 glycoside hydrolase [Marinilabilia rubra]PWD97853.1 hypothetical protein DDZ16_18485 [Marinilabilia rubra]
MNQFRNIICLLFLAVLIINPAIAQDNRTFETRIADLLVQMPVDDAEHRDRLMEEMLTLEKEGMTDICDRITPPGDGDDTRARFAVGSLSKYLSQSDHESDQQLWEGVLLDALEKAQNKDVKAFFIRNLEFAGTDKSLERLAVYIDNADLVAPVIKTILLIDKKVAAEIFSEKLPDASEDVAGMLIKGLGNSGDKAYVPQIVEYAEDANGEGQLVAWEALSKLPHPDAEKYLMKAARSDDYNGPAAIALLDYAKVVAEEYPSEALSIAEKVQKKTGDLQVSIQAMLVQSALLIEPARTAFLVNQMESSNTEYRGAIIQEAIRVKSPASQWVDYLKESDYPGKQAEVLYLLGKLGDNEVKSAIPQYLNSNNSDVRNEAAMTYALLAKGQAVEPLLDYLESQSGVADQKAGLEALLVAASRDELSLMTQRFSSLPAEAQVAVLKCFAARGDARAFDTVYKAADSEEGQVRHEALKTLKEVSEEQNLRALLKLFNRITKKEVINSVGEAIVAAVESAPDKVAAVQLVYQAASSDDESEKYLSVFSGIGGRESVDAVWQDYSKNSSQTSLEALINWNDHYATTVLHHVITGDFPLSHKSKVFYGYVNMVDDANLPDDQKLLLLRKVMAEAQDDDQKAAVLEAAGDLDTFLAFVFARKFLDEENLADYAANAMANIAMPAPGKDTGLSGDLIEEGLREAKEKITGQDAQYLKIDIDNYLKEMPEGTGYVSLFNGKDLSGWQGFVANPIKKAQLSESELENLQEKANEEMHETWSVQDGKIVFNGKGANLCTVEEYGDFEMIVDWRITKDGDSGIYLRGTPQVQVWDTSRVEVGAQVGSGGLYNNQKHESDPLVVADNPVGDWNTFRIKMVGEKVTVYLNGQLVVDNVVMENYWDRSMPIFPEGPVELQAHGTNLAFRDIYVKEIDSSAHNLTEEEQEKGFVALFNGSDLSGWQGNKTDYLVEKGQIVVKPQGGGHGNLFTEEEYDNFIYRFEFKLTPGANNGLGIRAPLVGDAAYVGMELQILDNTAPVYANLKPYQYHGSVYGVIPAKRGYLKPVGEWNSQEVIVDGTHVKVILNDQVILDGDIEKASENGTLDGKDHPGLDRMSGHIGFLGHGSVVYFRNIRIKKL